MSIGAIAARLYTIQTKKNVPLTTAISSVVRENLAVRFSVYSLVKSITKSETLATIAQAKYGQKTPQEKQEEKEKQSAKQTDLKFRKYVAGSIVALNAKINALATVTEKNTQLIESMYNEVGNYRRQRKVNVKGMAQVSTRVPLREKTIKGKLDQINADLQKIKEMGIASKKKRLQPTAKTKKEAEKESGGLLGTILGGLLKNPALMMAIGAGRPALALARYGIPAYALMSLPGNVGRISGRLQGQPGYADPTTEAMSQAMSPIMAGIGTYTGGMLLTNAYQKFKGSTPSTADKLYGSKIQTMEMERDTKIKSMTEKVQTRYKDNSARDLAKLEENFNKRRAAAEKRFNKEIKKAKTQSELSKLIKRTTAEREKAGERYRAQRAQVRASAKSVEQIKSNMAARIKANVSKQYEIPVGKTFEQMKKWNKISSALSGVSKRIPSFALAYAAYKIAEMSNYVVDYETGKMSRDEYRTNMVQSYKDIADAVGPAGIGMLLGGLAGTAMFPGIGTGILASVGGALGMAYGLFSDSFGEGSYWLAEKLFEIFHDDEPAKRKQKPEVAVPSEDQLKEEQKVSSDNKPPAISTETGGGFRTTRGGRGSRGRSAIQAAPPVSSSSGRPLLDFIGSIEAYPPGNYNSLWGGKSANLTEMTIEQVLQLQRSIIEAGGHSAAGKYQFIRSTLMEEAKAAGLDITKTKFDQETQDKLIYQRLVRVRGLEEYRKGNISAEQFAENLSMEFASLPSPIKGQGVRSYYAGDNVNKALTSLDTVYAILGVTAGQNPATPIKGAQAVRRTTSTNVTAAMPPAATNNTGDASRIVAASTGAAATPSVLPPPDVNASSAPDDNEMDNITSQAQTLAAMTAVSRIQGQLNATQKEVVRMQNDASADDDKILTANPMFKV